MSRLPADAEVLPAVVERRRMLVTGMVQGVGFRPFVYRLAVDEGLSGWVRNNGAGVEIEVEGGASGLQRFAERLRSEAPALACLERLTSQRAAPSGEVGFRIVTTTPDGEGVLPVSADAATCAECLREILDPGTRRHRYPFTNCTACGPRFTVIEALPYDRERTTMRVFPMCEGCRDEYLDPADRRFHAEPIACPSCGPRLEYVRGDGAVPGDALEEAVRDLRDGRIVAIKGLGGFQLACDPASDVAVARLRQRKGRPSKPFAVLVAGVEEAKRLCVVGAEEEALLGSARAPIVLLRRRPDGGSTLSQAVAPGIDTLGVMLPPTPLHHLLARSFGRALLLTSGNRSEEPIAADNQEVMERLRAVADAFLLHDRGIVSRYDDSVARVDHRGSQLLRRARGFAPEPLRLPRRAPVHLLAVGAQLKNTFCLLREDQAFLSQHIGDMDDALTLSHYLQTLQLYRGLFGVAPRAVAFDLHPDYATSRLARSLTDMTPVAVQHHHAHVVSCLAEHGVEERAIGVALDGSGYGTDGAVWGGELLIADWRGFERVAHLRYLPLPGGDAAAREPWRMAVAALLDALGDGAAAEVERRLGRIEPQRLRAVVRLAGTPSLTPLTSSAGRLFDAVAALAGVCGVNSYEGQAATELEARLDPDERGAYPLPLEPATDPAAAAQWDVRPLIRAVLADLDAGASAGRISARLHNALASAMVRGCEYARERSGIGLVVLSGGCFQNRTLAERVVQGLERAGFRVLTHRRVPPNDGGISLGQAAVALATLHQ